MTEFEETYYKFFTGLWYLFRYHYDAKTDEQWQELTDKAEKLVEKYGEITRPLVIDTLELIENNHKNSPK